MDKDALIAHMEEWFDETSAKMRAIENNPETTKLMVEGMEFAIRELKRYLGQ